MYDVLVYLFENCQQTEVAYDRDRVAKKLSAAGFEDSDISEALHWLAGVVRAPQAGLDKLPDRVARVEDQSRGAIVAGHREWLAAVDRAPCRLRQNGDRLEIVKVVAGG